MFDALQVPSSLLVLADIANECEAISPIKKVVLQVITLAILKKIVPAFHSRDARFQKIKKLN